MSKFTIACALISIVGFSVLGGLHIATTIWKTDAIAHGAAHYDAKTGEFTWNNAIEEKAK